MHLVSFATELLDALGSVVERDGPGAFRALLEPALAARLGLPEEARLLDPTTGEAPPDPAIPLAHGSDLVARLVAEAIGSGRVARLAADVPPPRAKILDAALREALRPTDGIVRVQEVLPGTAEYLVVGFRYAATGDERREGLVEVAVSLDGTATAAALPEALWANEHVLRDARPIAPTPVASAAWRAAARLARPRVLQALAPVREIVAHRLERDVLRLHAYYRAMQTELLRTAARRHLAPPDLEKLLDRMNGIPHEFERRVAEARTRLALRVDVRAAVAVRVAVPALFARVRLLRHRQERELLLPCDGLQRAFAVPLCEACGATPVPAPTLCNDRMHLLCDDCLRECSACGTRTCLACRRQCRKCGARLEDPAASTHPQRPAAAESTPPAAAPARPSAPPSPPAVAPPPPRPSRPPLCPSPRPEAAPDAERRGTLALASVARTLARTLGCASPEDQVRDALHSLGRAGTTLLARHTGLPPDVIRRTLADLRGRGEVVSVGHGRGTEYHLT